MDDIEDVAYLQATGDRNYLEDAEDFYQMHRYNEGSLDAKNIFNWVTYYWGLNVLLAQTTNENAYHETSQTFLRNWVCAINGVSPPQTVNIQYS